MRAMAAFPAERRVRAVDHPEPEIFSPTQVALRVLEEAGRAVVLGAGPVVASAGGLKRVVVLRQ